MDGSCCGSGSGSGDFDSDSDSSESVSSLFSKANSRVRIVVVEAGILFLDGMETKPVDSPIFQHTKTLGSKNFCNTNIMIFL
jgi:hypothetical protein